jgi:hypothetical protein
MTKARLLNKWLWIAILLVAALLAGCSDDPVEPGDQTRSREFWMGTYVDPGLGDNGVIVIDFFRQGERVTGDIVLKSRVNKDPNTRLYVKGTSRGNDLSLTLDSSRIPGTYQFQMTIQGSRSPGLGLTATLVFTSTTLNLNATVTCDALELGDIEVVETFDLFTTILSLAFDGKRIWAATRDYGIGLDYDFRRLDLDGALLDQFRVYYLGQYRWTSSALAADSVNAWGFLPGTWTSPDTTMQISSVQELSMDGEITREFRVDHRIAGLAVEGDDLWSLQTGSRYLRRFDKDGNILETIEIGVPDLTYLEFDGTHFWGTGYWLRRLYQIDKTGAVIRVFEPPDQDPINDPRGIAFDGTHLWYAVEMEDDPAGRYQSRIRKLRVVEP